MKTLAPIVIGTNTISISVERIPPSKSKPYAVKLTATCGTEIREASLTLHPNAAHTPDEVQKNIQARAQKLAEETVGHLIASQALDTILK